MESRIETVCQAEAKYKAFSEALNRESLLISKHCAVCTRPIILTKDGVKKQCDNCEYMKIYHDHMESVRQSLCLS